MTENGARTLQYAIDQVSKSTNELEYGAESDQQKWKIHITKIVLDMESTLLLGGVIHATDVEEWLQFRTLVFMKLVENDLEIEPFLEETLEKIGVAVLAYVAESSTAPEKPTITLREACDRLKTKTSQLFPDIKLEPYQKWRLVISEVLSQLAEQVQRGQLEKDYQAFYDLQIALITRCSKIDELVWDRREWRTQLAQIAAYLKTPDQT